MQQSLEEAKAALSKAKDNMARYYNRRRRPAPELQVGDRVYLDTSDLRTTRPSAKLAHRYIGPYSITKKVGRNTYRLQLPASMSRIHPVFNIVKLLPVPTDPIPGRQAVPPPPPQLINEEEHYEVEQILNSRWRRNRLEYLVKWKGYGYEENSWVHKRSNGGPAFGQAVPPGPPDSPDAFTDSSIQLHSLPLERTQCVGGAAP
jgi:hypothetical protein